MGALTLVRSLNRNQRNAFIASFLGWTLDAFDYFVLTFVVLHIAHDFAQQVATVTLAVTATLATRWIGALIFGFLADKFGRRGPLMIDILFYSIVELATAFSPNLTVFFILRILYGIGMGGEWGVGASLALESVPAESRGFFSGLLQEGYSCGYLLAAIAYFLVYPNYGWRPLFVIGVLPALLVIFIRLGVKESPVWEQRRERQQAQATRAASRARLTGSRLTRMVLLYIYAILLMSAFNYMSHGTQDLYPTFLEAQRKLPAGSVTIVAIIFNIGAIIGGMVFGFYSQRWGRRRSIIIAAILGILVIPLWVFAPSVAWLTVGAFLMQFFVQGAWGVIPIHLNEISPGGARGTFPGFTYQIGNVISAPAIYIEAAFAKNYFPIGAKGADYAKAQAIVALIVFVAVIFFTALGRFWIGPEKRGIDFVADEEVPAEQPRVIQPQDLPRAG